MEIKRNNNESEVEYTKRKGYIHQYIEPRFIAGNKSISQKSVNMLHVGNADMDIIKAYWKKFLPHSLELVNFSSFNIYNAIEKDKSNLKYYIPESFFYAFIDEYFTNPKRSVPVDDKNLYDLYFYDINRPKTICRKIDGVFMDEKYNPIPVEDFISLCESNDEVVIKSAIYSYGGYGVKFWKSNTDSIDKLLNYIDNESWTGSTSRSCKQYVVQESIKQSKQMAVFNPDSVNTIRIMTLVRSDDTNILSSVLRMGKRGSRVDNCSSGGIVCGIDSNGCLKDVAYDNKANAYYKHPNGVEFAGFAIPAYSQCLEIVKKLAVRFAGISRLISFDIAIDENNSPLLIEMNISYGELDFHQLCNGPIFGDNTDEILREVVDKSWSLRKLIGVI